MGLGLLVSTAYTVIITVPVMWGLVISLKSRNPDHRLPSLLPAAGFALLELALLLDWGTLLFVSAGDAESIVERHSVALNVSALTVLICYVLGSGGLVLGRIVQLHNGAR